MPLFDRHKALHAADIQPFFALNDIVKVVAGDAVYPSRVEDIRGASIWIAWPAAGGASLPLRRGSELILVSNARTGLRQFRVRVEELIGVPPPQVRVGHFEDMGRLQRREYVRVPGAVPIRFRVLESPGPRPEGIVEATSKDISGGGLLVFVHRENRPQAGDRLEVMVDLPGMQLSSARAEVIRVDPVPEAHDELYVVAIRFTEIEEQVRDLIVRSVFARQSELHRAGLL